MLLLLKHSKKSNHVLSMRCIGLRRIRIFRHPMFSNTELTVSMKVLSSQYAVLDSCQGIGSTTYAQLLSAKHKRTYRGGCTYALLGSKTLLTLSKGTVFRGSISPRVHLYLSPMNGVLLQAATSASGSPQLPILATLKPESSLKH